MTDTTDPKPKSERPVQWEAAENYLWECADETYNVVAIFGDAEDCARAARALNGFDSVNEAFRETADQMGELQAQADQKDAEIARLKGQIEQIEADWQEHDCSGEQHDPLIIESQRQEIARLRGALADRDGVIAGMVDLSEVDALNFRNNSDRIAWQKDAEDLVKLRACFGAATELIEAGGLVSTSMADVERYRNAESNYRTARAAMKDE